MGVFCEKIVLKTDPGVEALVHVSGLTLALRGGTTPEDADRPGAAACSVSDVTHYCFTSFIFSSGVRLSYK